MMLCSSSSVSAGITPLLAFESCLSLGHVACVGLFAIFCNGNDPTGHIATAPRVQPHQHTSGAAGNMEAL